jgi:hypothetical protein
MIEWPLLPVEMLLIGSTHTTDNKHNMWYLYSGTSTHMACHHKWLSVFNPKCSTHNSIMLSNNATLAMRSSSDIQATIHIHNHPVTITLKGILYMPNLTKNLLSTSHLVQLGYTILLNHNSTTIQHPQASLPPLITHTEHNMLVIDLSLSTQQALMTCVCGHSSSNLITLDQLHLCMGHISTVWLR